MNNILSLNGDWLIDYLSEQPYMGTEEPRILEGITEEMLIDQIISGKRQSNDEKQLRSKIEQAFFLKTLSKNGE